MASLATGHCYQIACNKTLLSSINGSYACYIYVSGLILKNPPSTHIQRFQEIAIDLKYSKYYSFLMLDSSHTRFALEVE